MTKTEKRALMAAVLLSPILVYATETKEVGLSLIVLGILIVAHFVFVHSGSNE